MQIISIPTWTNLLTFGQSCSCCYNYCIFNCLYGSRISFSVRFFRPCGLIVHLRVQIIRPCWRVVIHIIELLIALNLVTVQCIYIMIYNTFRYIICRVHFCSHKGCSFLCKSCWCTLFNIALLQQPELLLCCCVECTEFHAVICQLLQFLTFMLLACISCNTLMFVQHLL